MQLLLALVAAVVGGAAAGDAASLSNLLRDSPWQLLSMPLSIYVGLPPLRLLLVLWGPSRGIRKAACSRVMHISMHAAACAALLCIPAVALAR